jgi:hypothetical protein
MRLAKELDPTRLVTRVTDHWSHRLGERGNRLHFDVDDVICLNDYPWMLDMGYAEPARLPEQSKWWADGLAKVHGLYPDKPILVSEFGYQGFEGVYDNTAGEDRQAAVIEANLAGMTADYVCGAAIWVFADHASAMGFRRDQPTRQTIGTYGTLTRARKPKQMVYDTVRRIFAERQGRG